jgi:predicted metal-dependent hydrolase
VRCTGERCVGAFRGTLGVSGSWGELLEEVHLQRAGGVIAQPRSHPTTEVVHPSFWSRRATINPTPWGMVLPASGVAVMA